MIQDQHAPFEGEQQEKDRRRPLAHGELVQGTIVLPDPERDLEGIVGNQRLDLVEQGLVGREPMDEPGAHGFRQTEALADRLFALTHGFGEGDAVRRLGGDQPLKRLWVQTGSADQPLELVPVTGLLALELHVQADALLQEPADVFSPFPPELVLCEPSLSNVSEKPVPRFKRFAELLVEPRQLFDPGGQPGALLGQGQEPVRVELIRVGLPFDPLDLLPEGLQGFLPSALAERSRAATQA